MFADHTKAWSRAGQLAELGMFFKSKPEATSPALSSSLAASGVKPGSLRRIKILAQLDDAHLEALFHCMELLRFQQFASVVAKGDHGDAMYFVLEGELRARTLIDGKETILSTLAPGEFFGEISLLDQGPRSLDVIANTDSAILRLSAQAFEKMVRETPELATPVLYALSKSIVGRVRILTKRYEDSIHLARVAGNVGH